MRTKTYAAIAALAVSAGAALAAGPTLERVVGTEPDAIATALSTDGYYITRYEAFPDTIAVTAIKEDHRLELALDRATGSVLGVAEYNRSSEPASAVLTDSEIRARLAAEGYVITEFEREGGEIEVYATRDGRRWELKIDPASGRILKIEGES